MVLLKEQERGIPGEKEADNTVCSVRVKKIGAGYLSDSAFGGTLQKTQVWLTSSLTTMGEGKGVAVVHLSKHRSRRGNRHGPEGKGNRQQQQSRHL